MTKFQIMSDLHHEFHDKPLLAKEDIVGDVLLLPGDITAGSTPIDYLKNLGIPIYYILGNHEFYKRHWIECIKEYRDRFDNSPVTFMECDTTVHNNVRIIAATLWTDFLAPVKGKPFFDATSREPIDGEYYIENQAFYCKQSMADFDLIGMISASAWMERHNKSRDYIKMMLSEEHDGPTVVMTHHAPSFKSSHPKWDNSAIKGGFCVDLEYIIEEFQPELWVHGHCHDASDYYIGGTRVVCNPRGYPSEGSIDFNPKLIVEL